MLGILSQSSRYNLMELQDTIGSAGGGINSSGTAITQAVTPISTATPSNPPSQDFDLSVLSGLKPSDKYLGKNRVSDIQEAYQTYITGSVVGRGGKYAADAAKKYGVSLIEAARGYLQGVGLPILTPAISTITPTPTATTPNTPSTPTTSPTQKTPFEILADILPSLFGNAVYNPPLQSQAYGYTPTTTEQPLSTSSGGSSGIGLLIILGVVGVIGYFLYKRFVN